PKPQLISHTSPIIDAKNFFSSRQNPITLPHQTPDKFTVTLDPTDSYQVPNGYRIISTELEWLQYFHVKELETTHHYWISGHYLCNLTRKWLELHELSHTIADEKQEPIIYLQVLLGDSIDLTQWQSPSLENYLYSLCDRLRYYQLTKPKADPIIELLADITENYQIWTDAPSINHLAQWLLIDIHNDFQPFEKYWQ
ncbi:MAG: hypothetical protein ACK46E_21410, partial [Pseudanabaena sp.]